MAIEEVLAGGGLAIAGGALTALLQARLDSSKSRRAAQAAASADVDRYVRGLLHPSASSPIVEPGSPRGGRLGSANASLTSIRWRTR